MGKVTPTDPKFAEDIAGAFYQMLRAAGITMVPSSQHDRIRQIAQTLAESIEYKAETKAVEVAKKLQEGVKQAFIAMEKDLKDNYARKPKRKRKSPYLKRKPSK